MMNEANVEPNIRPPAMAARIAMAAVIAYQVRILALIRLRPDLAYRAALHGVRGLSPEAG